MCLQAIVILIDANQTPLTEQGVASLIRAVGLIPSRLTIRNGVRTIRSTSAGILPGELTSAIIPLLLGSAVHAVKRRDRYQH